MRMNRITSLFCFLLLFSNVVISQSSSKESASKRFFTVMGGADLYERPAVSLGIKVGVSVASTSGGFLKDLSNLSSITSPLLGVVANIRITDKLLISPELHYARQGFGSKTNGYSLKVRHDYINLPLMVKYYIPVKPICGLFVEAGPQLGMKINTVIEEGKSKGAGLSTRYTNNLDFGIGLGLGYELFNGCYVSLRYTKGLTNVIKVEDMYRESDLRSDEVSNKNSLFQISIGYNF